MLFDSILGYEPIKKYLIDSVEKQRIPHAQLFIGSEGSGVLPMAIAYASYILCKNNSSCLLKCEHLSHPDLHFAFPVATNDKIKKDAVSSLFLEDWRKFIAQKPYGSLYDWLSFIGIEKKQGNIGVNEAKEITAKLSLKAFEGGYKVMIIWMAEKMNVEAANKLLKLLEEPPQQTIFLLICEDETAILDTIKSRCQVLHFQALSQNSITEALVKKDVSEAEATRIAIKSNGNFNKALSFLEDSEENDNDSVFEKWFIEWVRTAYKAKGNKASINGLLAWSEAISEAGREKQKQFLTYCTEIFRQAFLYNYEAKSLVYASFNDPSFEIKKFAPFVHGNNIELIFKQLEDAFTHIERNANAKIIFTDLSIKLTRLLHAKSV